MLSHIYIRPMAQGPYSSLYIYTSRLLAINLSSVFLIHGNNDDPLSHLTETGSMRVQQSLNGKDPSNPVSSHETPLSMGEILLSLDAGIQLPGPGVEYPKDRHSNKPNGTQQHVKHSNSWGHNNVRNKSDLLLLFPV